MLVEYIKEKQKINLKLHGVPVIIKDEVSFSLERAIAEIEKILPSSAFRGIKQVIITDLEKVAKRLPFNAYYINNIIYVSNKQDGILDVTDDVIHEVSHHLEKNYYDLIYGDKTLESEFTAKRGYLYDILSYNEMNPPAEVKTDIKYNKKTDDYFFNKLGSKLINFSKGLFIDDYSVTSLREYYGTGFEKYLISYNNHTTLKKQSPVLFSKIEKLLRVIDGEEHTEQ